MAEQARYQSVSDDVGKGNRYAILVADMLNDFVHGKLQCERAKRIIPNIKQLLDDARKKGIPVFYCNDEHIMTDAYEMKLWGPHALKGTEGAKVIDELRPQESDHIIPKRRYSAFDETELDKAMKGAYKGRGADAVIITGMHTHICGIHTAYDAFVRGLNIIVPEDGVDAFTEKDHVSGLDYMKNVYGAKITNISDIISGL